jgi:hypothetical protein
VPQRRVVERREEKGDADLGEQRLGGGRRQVAATIVAIVDTLTVCAPSAPLPTRSVIGPGMLIGVACASMPAARPDISSAVSPLARSPTPNPAIWAGDAAPSMISFIAQAVWLALSGWPLISARISAGQVGPSTDGAVTGALPIRR